MKVILWVHVFVDTEKYKVVDDYEEIGQRYDDMCAFPPDGDVRFEKIVVTTGVFDDEGDERGILSDRLKEIAEYLNKR